MTSATAPAPGSAAAPAVAAASGAAALVVDSRALSVPVYLQTYSLSCEESALRMALAAEGIQTTDAQILALVGVEWGSAHYDATGLRWGDPYTGFVGNPAGSEVAMTGYGTYYPTVAQAAAALGGQVLQAGEGITPAEVYAAVLAGHPVVACVTYVWVTAARADYVATDGRLVP